MNINSDDDEKLEEKIAQAKEWLKKATFGVLAYLGTDSVSEISTFLDYKNLPEWRRIFSSMKFEAKRRFLKEVQDSWKKIFENVDEPNKCLKFFVECEYFNRNGWPFIHPSFGKDSENERVNYFRIQIKQFVEAYVSSFGQRSSDDAFEAIFRPFKKHFPDFKKTINKEVAVLTGLELISIETIDFEDFEIREIDPVELGILEYIQSSDFGCYTKVNLNEQLWVCELKNVVEAEIFEGDGDWGFWFPDNYIHPHEIEDQVLTFLRLFRAGRIGISSRMTYESIKWGEMSFGQGTGLEQYPWSYMRKYTICFDDKEELKKSWRAFSNIKNEQKERYKVATRRFNLAIENKSKEDQIVDAMISLESIFSLSGKKYIGVTLGQSLEDMIGKSDSGFPVLATIKMGYRARNWIVHGKDLNLFKFKIEQKELRLEEVLGIIMEWLRKALFSKLMST